MLDHDKLLSNVATLTEQGRWVAKELAELRADVKSLNAFRARSMGAGVVCGVLGSFALEFLKNVMAAR